MGNICFGGTEERKTAAFENDPEERTLEAQIAVPATTWAASAALSPQQQKLQQSQLDPRSPAVAAELSATALPAGGAGGALGGGAQQQPFPSSSSTPPPQQQQQQQQQHQQLAPESSSSNNTSDSLAAAYLQSIVQQADRTMVAVQSTRGSTGYYDQGFAAALSQHLESKTSHMSKASLPTPLPPPVSHNAQLYSVLNQPEWEQVRLLPSGSASNPSAYVDQLAEQFLDHVVPKKERVFSNVAPIVESLL